MPRRRPSWLPAGQPGAMQHRPAGRSLPNRPGPSHRPPPRRQQRRPSRQHHQLAPPGIAAERERLRPRASAASAPRSLQRLPPRSPLPSLAD